MALTSCYLTSKQLKIWNLKRKGFLEARIAKELDITRQTVHKAADVADNKVQQALMETAKLNRISVKAIDPVTGVLSGFSAEFKTPVMITFSARNGVQVWYKHEGNCERCDHLDNCRKTLLTEMEERNIQPPKSFDSTPPSKVAELLFQKITGE